MSNSDRNRLGNCWKSYVIYFVCRISKKQKTLFLIVNTKGLQREREVPKYAKYATIWQDIAIENHENKNFARYLLNYILMNMIIFKPSAVSCRCICDF